MNMKKIIWSLFDSETGVTQALRSDVYEVYSIGLASASSVYNGFIHIDLSRRSCLRLLAALPPPDIVLASPPCETWVLISVGNVRHFTRNNREYNLYWQKDLKPNDFNRRLRDKRLLMQRTAHYTARIIKEFKPAFWAIENGRSSLIFRYLREIEGLVGYRNECYYSAYDSFNFSEKPTTIYSNRLISLRNEKIVSNKRIVREKGKDCLVTYAERSRVPIGVYRDIINAYEGKGQLSLF